MMNSLAHVIYSSKNESGVSEKELLTKEQAEVLSNMNEVLKLSNKDLAVALDEGDVPTDWLAPLVRLCPES